MATIVRTSKVFVPGGLPKLTYNPRKTLDLENTLKKAKDNLCKLVMVTGSTKSGKTVLTSTVFNRTEVVWLDGGSYSNENDLWVEVASQLGAYTDTTSTEDNTEAKETTFKGSVEKNILIAKATGGADYKTGNTQKIGITNSRKDSPKGTALNALRISEVPLIIDDFHYIPREEQGNIVRALKALVFEGIPVVFLAIPHRRLDAVKVEREMTGRIENISVPAWSIEELKEIGMVGFPLLNVKVNDSILTELASESIGSPHLMQEFCRELCELNDVQETSRTEIVIDTYNREGLFKKVAIGTGKIMFDKLKKGPRQRSDRMSRRVRDGLVTDIYGLVLYGLAELKPGMEKVDYEELRSKIREISTDKPPEAHEISRVLDHMSNIASSDEASTPVLDWEKEDRVLHITDPFFAYFLRWGLD